MIKLSIHKLLVQNFKTDTYIQHDYMKTKCYFVIHLICIIK